MVVYNLLFYRSVLACHLLELQLDVERKWRARMMLRVTRLVGTSGWVAIYPMMVTSKDMNVETMQA